jgi:HEAT repeat protein
MAKNQGIRHVERFDAAAVAGQDAQAEALADLLTADDLPVLHHMLESGHMDRCWWGIRGLAKVGNADSIPQVVDQLHHADPAIRSAAAMALGEMHARHAQAVTPHLSQLVDLLADSDGLAGQAASNALALCGDDAVNVLAEALRSDLDSVRVRAAAALHRIGTPKAAIPLYRHLEDPNPLVRHHAYEALDDLGLLNNLLLSR